MGQRTIKGRRQFLVRWKGYDADSDTWEQEKDLNCLELIEEFLAENAENEEDPKSKQLDNSTKSPKVKAVKVDKKSKKLKNNVKKQTENGIIVQMLSINLNKLFHIVQTLNFLIKYR